ncbi:hypothetical protein L6452_41198 [Arctium lappa]|uniref:Uncharacterized protein n=1 Tax=Arctium lappa TaxID=4217 RepID=A0ACB8XNJ1_ARCLA|nr:hypothetical protein L6452_41198 [Arctium lappa]
MTKSDDKPESSSSAKSLHPAYSVSNIQTKIRTLEGSKVTYSSWVKLFRFHAIAYKVLDHLNDTPVLADTDPSYESWKELDALDADWDLARTMLTDEVIRLEARKQQSSYVLVTPVAPAPNLIQQQSAPSDPNNNNTSQQPQSQYRGRGRGRGQQYRGRGRGRGNRNSQSNWPFQNNSYPQWSWWNTPPYPYPTQTTWRPNQPPQYPSTTPSANYAGFPPPGHFGNTQHPAFTVFDALNPSYLSVAFNTMQLNYTDPNYYFDTGAEQHVTDNRDMIQHPNSFHVHTKILVGNGNVLPIAGSGTGFLPIYNRNYILPNIIYSPQIIKNLLSVRKFTRDNNVSIEFDPFGFSLKDLKTGRLLSRHNSTGNLYPVTPPTLPPQACSLTSTSLPWHDRLGHPGAQHGLLFRFSCPQTSSQNGRDERMIRRLNDIIRALLIHAHLPPTFWVEALHTAAYLHNILPTKRLNFFTPTFALYLRHPTYDHLRVFGCACYPNSSATQPHKLHTHSVRCIFLGYPPDFRGYRCFDPTTGKVTISRHVTFDEKTFPYTIPTPNANYNFLDDLPHGFTFTRPIPRPTPKPTQPAPHSTSPFQFTYTSRPRPPAPLPTPNPPASIPTVPSQAASSASSAPIGNNTHPMTTRSKAKHTLFSTAISPVPTSYSKAFTDPHWLHAM